MSQDSESITPWLRLRRWLGHTSVLGVLLSAGVGVFLLEFTLGSRLRETSYDWLFALRPTVPVAEAFIVNLDEQSHVELKQPMNAAWDRALHARLVDRLTRAGAKAIVFDIVFLDTQQELTPSDQALVRAAKASGRVVLGANPRPQAGMLEPAADPPFDALRDAVDDRWGIAEMIPDRDQVVRRMPPSYPPFKHSLAWATAIFLGAPVTRTATEAAAEAAESEERWLNYYGPANSMAHCSYWQALDERLVPDTILSNRVVFVGASTLTRFSAERKDSYLSPFSTFANDPSRVFISGVEIQATAALNLLRGDWVKRSQGSTELVVTLLVGVGCGLGFQIFRPRLLTLVFVLFQGLVVAVPNYLFRAQLLWTPWLIWMLQGVMAYGFAIAANSVRLYVQNQVLEQTVASYVGRKLARKYVRERRRDFLKPGARKQELTIFFSDIAGFTTLSEGMDSSELAAHMNRYFETAVEKCIHSTDGTVVKYIGDAIFAFWNAPDEQPDNAERACEAALRFREQPVQEMNCGPLITRIGLHTGVANVGNFGSAQRVDYTALGENINLASRLEGLNKHLGTLTLMSGETYERVRSKFVARPLGRFVLKGFERQVAVYELLGRAGSTQSTEARDALFASALETFQAGRFEHARTLFRESLKADPNDGPSLFYLGRIDDLLSNPPGVFWKGEVELHEK